MTSKESIFISYRRTASQDVVGRIDDYLSRHFGREHVFLDRNSIDYEDAFSVPLRAIAGAETGVLAKGWGDRATLSQNSGFSVPPSSLETGVLAKGWERSRCSLTEPRFLLLTEIAFEAAMQSDRACEAKGRSMREKEIICTRVMTT